MRTNKSGKINLKFFASPQASLTQRRKGVEKALAKERRPEKRFLCAFAPLRETPFLSALLVFFLLAFQPQIWSQTRISIDTTVRANAISPMLYGHFMEFMFEDVKGGLWAELLRNRGFENRAPEPSVAHYWERYPDTRIDDSIAFSGKRFGLSEEGYPPSYPNRSQIIVSTFPLQPHGMYQNDVPVRVGTTYQGSVWLRGSAVAEHGAQQPSASGYDGKVRVSLEENTTGGEVYAWQDLGPIAKEWRRFDFSLPAGKTDLQARFTIQLLGSGAVWVDQVSLIPGDAVGGVRADVLEKVKALKPAFLRWPGGNVAQDYHWEWGIGPRDERPVWVNMSWNNDPEPADFGTPEYLAFCKAVGAEPTLVVNVEGRGATVPEAARMEAAGQDIRKESRAATAEEAAAWVEYCNGAATTRFGGLRARDGHPEPYGVKYWEIGNEIWGDWVRGHSDAPTYAANAKRYIRAMKAVDPSIKIIAVGDNDMDWNQTVVRELANDIDFLAIHHYYGATEMKGDVNNLMARPLFYDRFYGKVRTALKQWGQLPGRPIKLAINEWNTWLPLPREHSMEAGLYAARLLNVFERNGDLIAMSAVSDLVNGWIGGIIQASRHRVFTTPTYQVIKAYNDHRGTTRVGSEVRSDVTYDPSDSSLGSNIPALDVVATVNQDGSELYIKVVNTSVRQPVTVKFEVSAGNLRIVPDAQVLTINGPDLDSANTFDQPQTVGPQEGTLDNAGDTFQYTFQKHSVTILTLTLKSK